MLALFLRSILIFSVAVWPFKTADQDLVIRKSQLALPADFEAFNYIRVLILDQKKSFSLDIAKNYVIKEANGRQLFQGSQLTNMEVRRDGAFLVLGIQRFETPFIRIESKQGTIKINQNSYAESIAVLRGANGLLQVVNEISLERYLKGVLPKEAIAAWPAETLKAQAVASRTFALFKMLERQDEVYDVSADVTSQVYGGEDAQDERTNAAVDATRGLILTYNNKIFPAFFHSNSGGYTTTADSIWDVESHPSLKGVESTLSLKEANGAWHGDFTLPQIEQKLKAYGIKVNGLQRVKMIDKDFSGRYRYVLLYDSAGKLKMRSSEFRMAMDPFKFKSTLITSIYENGNTLTFRGLGWGHGVGLCQYGSKKLGSLGYTYEQILKYYYPLSNITRFGK